MSPVLFEFEDNDFCLFCLCFFLLHFIFCDSESDTLLFYSAALTSTANLHERRKGCFFIIFFHSKWYFIAVEILGGLSIRTSHLQEPSILSVDLLIGLLEQKSLVSWMVSVTQRGGGINLTLFSYGEAESTIESQLMLNLPEDLLKRLRCRMLFCYLPRLGLPPVPDIVKGHAYFSFPIAPLSGFYYCPKQMGVNSHQIGHNLSMLRSGELSRVYS